MRSFSRIAPALVLAGLISGQARAQGPDQQAPKGRQYAILIGVEKYQKAWPLRYTINDVKTIATVLRDRGGFADADILTMSDDADFPARRPTLKNMVEEIPRWLSAMKPEDRLIVYFSGHGFQDTSGKLYLAPIDVDPARPAATGIPGEWLRKELSGCKAGFKLLVIDACHAGTAKSADDPGGATARQVGDTFRDLSGVVTLASSTDDEKSQIWEEKRQSLFSYWLAQGLKGHADTDGDGEVDVDELNKFVHRGVVRTASSRPQFFRPQTPVWIAEKPIEGSPVVLELRPQSLKALLADVAEQFALVVVDRKLKKVGVVQFTCDSPFGELLGSKSGSIGRHCADEIEGRLIVEGENKFDVINGKAIQQVLAERNFTHDDLARPDKMAELSSATNGLSALAQGTIRARTGQIAVIRCKLYKTEGDVLAGSAGGIVHLTPSEWGMFGQSAAVPSPLQDNGPRPDDQAPSADPSAGVIAQLDDKARLPHPMTDSKFEFPVRIFVGGVERAGHAEGNDWIVPLRKGEKFDIRVENRTGRPVCLRLLVDGLNTLPEREMFKGAEVYLWGKHVSLDTARHWILDPAKVPGPIKSWVVDGFVTKTGEKGRERPFIVSTSPESLASQRHYTEQIGLITAAFYESVVTRGIIAGDEIDGKLPEDDRFRPGNLRAVVNIRYTEQ